MTPFRRQLLDLQSEYAAARYPSDLGEVLLGGTRARSFHRAARLRLVMGWACGALAAGVALAVLVYDPAAEAVQDSFQRITQSANELPFIGRAEPATSSPAENFSIFPEFRSIDVPLPPTPAMPTVDWGTGQESA